MAVDPGTGLTVLGAALGSAKLVEKLLGPTAEYIGEGIRDWTEQRTRNVKRIFTIAARNLGDKINAKGTVPPKVLKGILSDGSFCDDLLTAEYFGGVVASSRSTVSRDDRGASFVALITRLSVYQLRTHYVFYYIIKELFNGTEVDFSDLNQREAKMQVYVPSNVYHKALDFSEEEGETLGAILPHSLFGLAREQLLSEKFMIGTVEMIKKKHPEAAMGGILFRPSPLGLELFLWAHGRSSWTWRQFFDEANRFEIVGGIEINSGSQVLKIGASDE